MRRLDLSVEADADLNELLAYGTRSFGEAASDRYYLGLCDAFDFLCVHPQAGQVDEGTGLGLRRWRYGQHRIFYRVQPDSILIVRVFHVAADVVSRLGD